MNEGDLLLDDELRYPVLLIKALLQQKHKYTPRMYEKDDEELLTPCVVPVHIKEIRIIMLVSDGIQKYFKLVIEINSMFCFMFRLEMYRVKE